MKRHIWSENPVVGVFALDGEVQLYAETLRYMAWKLAGAGARIVRFGCTGVLETCTSLNSTNKSDLAKLGKEPVCWRCKASQGNIQAETVFEVGAPDLVASPTELSFLAQLRSHLVETRQAESVFNMSYDGIEVCRIAFFDFAIATKLSHVSVLEEPALERFISGVADQLTLLRALRRFHQNEKITHVLYVNGNYSQNTLIRIFFVQHGVKCVNIEPQLTSQRTLNKVLLTKDRLILDPDGLLPGSATARNSNTSTGHVKEVLKNFGARINGGDFNAYTSLHRDATSSAELQKLNAFLRNFSRTHAFFLSSEDELTPHIQTHGALNGGDLGSPSGFSSQADFTRYLLDAAVRYPEIGFVIRLHPRMAVNKRDHFESEEHIKYKQILGGLTLPENVFVLYGDSKISSYYVISEVDLVIIAWSTIGLEALLLGAPVVSIFPACLMYPLTAFSRQPRNKGELDAALFSKSDYGVADDDLLLRWLSRAFESQFFATAAPRSRGGLLGKVYRVWYRCLARYGFYGLAARLVSFLPSARVRCHDEMLLIEREVDSNFLRWNMKRSQQSLARYRKEHLHLLSTYGRSDSCGQ